MQTNAKTNENLQLMSRQNSTFEPMIVEKLRHEVERFLDRRMVTPADFEYLSQVLNTSVHQSVSATTLKRVWGYIRDAGENYAPGRYTLSTLARLIGFADIEDFDNRESRGGASVQSDNFFGITLNSCEIPEGMLMKVAWLPNRVIVIRHISGDDFMVERSEHSKLNAGDLLECHSFTQNAPLYVAKVKRGGEPVTTYVAGSRTGVHYQYIED